MTLKLFKVLQPKVTVLEQIQNDSKNNGWIKQAHIFLNCISANLILAIICISIKFYLQFIRVFAK